MIRWGIIGLGKIAHKFADDLLKVKDAQLTAVASTSLERANEFGDKYSAKFKYGSYEEILSCPELDVVYIATPHPSHHANTLMCLNAGIPVLCEKAFGMNLQEVQDMVETARAKNVFLMEALWSRFMPTIQKMLELKAADEIGTIRLLRADFGFAATYDPQSRLFNKALGGSALLDIGIYPIFLAYLTLGMPKSIKASAVLAPTGTDETTGIIFEYDEDFLAVLDCTFRATTPCEGLIYGDKGTVKIHGRWHESQVLTLTKANGDVQTYDYPRDFHGYCYEIEEVNQCLRNGKTESTLWSHTDSLNLMSLLDQIAHQIGLH